MTGANEPYDLILVGGGLADALIAYRLAQIRPSLRVLVLEAGASFGGNHTWSFHETDLTAGQRAWTSPLVAHRWPGYHVRFPDLQRRVDLAYCSATSECLHQVLTDATIPVRFGASARVVLPRSVELDSGETLQARAVVDGRGAFDSPHLRLGWQKFFGQEIRTAQPHGLGGPILMDATVEQNDGFRFVYVLPFAADRLLIEDTYYSDRPDLDVAKLRIRVTAYAQHKGWSTAETLREETGVLPITLAGDIESFWAVKQGQPCAGLRAGLFHPTTGYSWPDAVRLADHLATLDDLDAGALFAAIQTRASARWRKQGFFRTLNRMLFLAGRPDRRWMIMQRFYRFAEPSIARFYAGDLSWVDKVQLLVGRPPVSVAGALKAIMDRRVSVA